VIGRLASGDITVARGTDADKFPERRVEIGGSSS